MVDPWRDGHVRSLMRQSSFLFEEAAQVATHCWTHQLEIVIAGNDVDRPFVAHPATEGCEDRRMVSADAVELGNRQVVGRVGRFNVIARQSHSGKVEEVTEKQETMDATGVLRGLSLKVQPASECVVVGEWIAGIAVPRAGIAARSQVEVTHNDDGCLLSRRHAGFTLVTVPYAMSFAPVDHYCSTHALCG